MRPHNKSRQWRHPEGYKFLAPWTNAVLLRFLVRKFTATLPRSEYRSKAQTDDAARSVIANIEEGYKRPTTKEYLTFLGFSQGSLEEVKGDIKRVHQDGFLKSRPGLSLEDIGIDLKELKGLLKESKGKTLLEILYPPLKSLKGTELTLEIFLELIYKTDYLLRQLVNSLEKKAGKEMPLSPRERWLKAEMRRRAEEDRKMDEELKKIVEKARRKRKRPH